MQHVLFSHCDVSTLVCGLICFVLSKHEVNLLERCMLKLARKALAGMATSKSASTDGKKYAAMPNQKVMQMLSLVALIGPIEKLDKATNSFQSGKN